MGAEPISTYLLTQGVLGLGCLVLGGVVYKLYNKTDVLQKQINDLAEARRVDYKDTLKEVTDVLRDNSQNMRILSEKIEVGKSIDKRSRR